MSNVILPQDYVENCFYQYSNHIRKSNGIINGCCFFCKEGKTGMTGKKRRLFYIKEKKYIYCHNCQRSWNELSFIIEATGKTYAEVLREAQTYTSSLDYYNTKEQTEYVPEKIIDTELPKDAINLFDSVQVEYYKDNNVVKDALELIYKRRLNTLINHPKSLYVSLNDKCHKNRLIIPFYDINNKITFYQSRAIYSKDIENGRKYLSKLNSHKGVYGINNISNSLEYLFLTEGPIDCFSLKNGICIAGINITDYQKKMLEPFFLYKKFWCLDNQWIDKTSKEKTLELIESGETVFIWPKEYKQKDFNEICCDLKIDQISPIFILKNSFSKEIALLKLKIIQ